MARTRTLGQQAADAYKLADLENFTERYPLSEVYRYINQGNAEAYDLLVAARGYAYFGKPYHVLYGVTGTGTSPPVVSIVGVPVMGTRTSLEFYIDIVTGGTLGVATFRWKSKLSDPWSATIPTAAVVQISSLQIEFQFSEGTYNADNLYTDNTLKLMTAPGQQSYDLPSDFYKLHNIWLSSGGAVYGSLEPMQSVDEPTLQDATLTGTAYYYQIRHNVIDLLPTPNQAYEINLNYVPSSLELKDANAAFDGINGFEDYGVQYAARKMLLKEGDIEMANMVTQDLNKTGQRIQNMASERDAGAPVMVQDIRGALTFKRPVSRRFPRA